MNGSIHKANGFEPPLETTLPLALVECVVLRLGVVMAKKKAAVKTGCNCLDSVKVQLAERGLSIVRHLQMDFEKNEGRLSPPSIVVERTKAAKGKTPIVFCSYCPFCGTKY